MKYRKTNIQHLDIPEICYTKEQYVTAQKEIVVNLNDYLWLNDLIEEYRVSHRRWYPQISVVSPTGTSATFAYPISDKADLVYSGKSCNLRLTFK